VHLKTASAQAKNELSTVHFRKTHSKFEALQKQKPNSRGLEAIKPRCVPNQFYASAIVKD